MSSNRTGVKPSTSKITVVNEQKVARQPLTKLERLAKKEARRQSIRLASYAGDMGNSGQSSINNAESNFYSPQLSTDFLELPQSEREKRELIRFWYACFVPGTPILKTDGTLDSIENIKIGDDVVNGLGKPTKVINTFCRLINDEIVGIKVWGMQDKIRATGNHPFYILRSNQVNCLTDSINRPCKHRKGSHCKCRKLCTGININKPEFIYAKDLKIGDYILSPWIDKFKDCGLNRAQIRLLGYYAAKGSFNYNGTNKRIKGVNFSLNIDEFDTIAAEIALLYKQEYGKEVRIYKQPYRNGCSVRCYGDELANLCKKYVGCLSKNKRLHQDLVNAKPEQLLEFLGAYWNGGGCFTDNSYIVDFVSSCTASQVFQMLRKLQIPACLSSYYTEKDNTIEFGKQCTGVIYHVSFPGRYFDVFSKYANYVTGSYSITSSSRVYLTYCKYGFLHRIEKLEVIQYRGNVHNFEVCGEGDEKSYIANGLATHNSHPIVGAAIDFHCFPPGAPVMMKDGSVNPIESLNVGDEVINGLGEPTRVINTFQHDIRGPITRLKVHGVREDVYCTENHPFLIYRAEQVDCECGKESVCTQKEKCVGLDIIEPQFVFARDIKVGDCICSPWTINLESVLDINREYCIQIGSNILSRVERVETVQYIGPVYNIEVDGNEDENRKSYIAHGLATHNTDVPMSKIRLAAPKGIDAKRNRQILHFYQKMSDRIHLFQTLYDMTHEYWLHGVVFPFAEDHDMSAEIPEELIKDYIEKTNNQVKERKLGKGKKYDKEDAEKLTPIQKYVRDNYEGWQRVQILPPEQVKTEIFQYTNRTQMQLIPSEKDRLIVQRAQNGEDPEAQKIADDIPDQIKENLLSGQPIPLNTSPYDDFLCSSFCYRLTHHKSQYDDRGFSMIERCLRTLLMSDKLRQAQTSIASRAMTPKRVIWADKMSVVDVDDLRDQIDQALIDPDYSVITNFEVHWEEIGARDRLLDLSTEHENLNKLLYIGLRITESMLTGESTFSGERIHLDVMNTMYLLYRETLAEYVERMLFAPVAEKKGFWEIDNDGNKNLLYPRLQFTRLALRDNSEMQDFMFNLYQKGSMPIDYIYEILNIDSDDAYELLKHDALTPKDSMFNELSRTLLGQIGTEMATKTNAMDKIAKTMGLEVKDEPDKGGDRFGSGGTI